MVFETSSTTRWIFLYVQVYRRPIYIENANSIPIPYFHFRAHILINRTDSQAYIVIVLRTGDVIKKFTLKIVLNIFQFDVRRIFWTVGQLYQNY